MWHYAVEVHKSAKHVILSLIIPPLNSVRKRKLLINDYCKTVSGQFFANCILFFHKTEVQTVILRCLTGLDLNWFKSYGLKCSLMPCRLLANWRKIGSYKWPFYDHFWPFYDHFWPFFHQLNESLLQNRSS